MSRTAIGTCLGAFAAILLAGWGVTAMWRDLGVTLSLHGWIAYGLGAVLSLALSAGLFWLLFHSARSGHDDLERPEDLDG